MAAVGFAALLGLAQAAEKKLKPWTEWSEKDAQKILDDSPWGQTQVETDTSEMFYSPTTGGGRRAEQGALNQDTYLHFRIRFLSARPIRRAFARSMLLRQKSPNPQFEENLKQFAEQKSDAWIVVAVDYDSRDRRLSGPVMQILNSANTGVLKNKTYLELKNGRRLFLEEYRAPINDGMGAKFAFPRIVEGQPFIDASSGEVRFVSELTEKVRLNMRFKVTDMLYEGNLEY
jgi:hypothetical protein